MKVIKHFVQQWFNQDLGQWDGWKEYQQSVAACLKGSEKSSRCVLYQKHLDLINSNWGIQYAKTLEYAYIRELRSSGKDKSYLVNMRQSLMEKYGMAKKVVAA
jgi:hypothetical protein